jgi:hypothetical protein
MKAINVTVRGLPPGLLMCSPAGMLTEPTESAGPAPKAKKLPFAATAELLTYRLPDGSLGFPAVAFQQSAMEAGKGQALKVGGRGRAVSVPTLLAGLWEVEPKDLIPLLRDGEQIEDYEVDVRTGLNRNTRPPARIVLARPLITAPWDAQFAVLWDDVAGSEDTPATIRWCLERAGRRIGVGGFRPVVQGKATGGWFGKFEVVAWTSQD